MVLSNVPGMKTFNEAADIKGLDLVGIIDCHVPEVIAETQQLILKGDLIEKNQGGFFFCLK